MSLQEISAEHLAELFHHYHEALAADFGCEEDHCSAQWQELSEQERRRLVAATRLALLELRAISPNHNDNRKYFAEPGKAEWGC